nr:ubiquitin-conjugating enzyme E2 Z-like [Penaeus vannamei]
MVTGDKNGILSMEILFSAVGSRHATRIQLVKYSFEHKAGDSERYNTIIMHETIRVAVIQQFEGVTMVPADLMRVMEASFLEYYDHYVEICEKNMHLDGQTMVDPFREWRGHFQYATLLKNLKRLKAKIEAKVDSEVPENPITAESDDVSSISEDKPEP